MKQERTGKYRERQEISRAKVRLEQRMRALMECRLMDVKPLTKRERQLIGLEK